MAKGIYVCSRNPLNKDISNKLATICSELAPDNITPRPPRILVHRKTALAVMNPANTICINDDSLLMGMVINVKDSWYIPKTDFPEGSYAIFRNSDDFCEMVSDAVASRTLWYYYDDELFVGATSQRTIIMFIKNFEFNEKVIPWMLSTGSLGPEYSWDKRLKRVPPDSSILLDKKKWSITTKANTIVFNKKHLNDATHKTNLVKRLKDTFDKLDVDFSKWYLPLSGGVDSRGLLCLLAGRSGGANNLKTITWGTKEASEIKESDAYVAKELADYFNVSNTYYHTDISDEGVEQIFNRFLKLGEGRIDHISGYMDGFKIWKTLFENGVEGIIRGDEGFGWHEVASALYVRLSTGSSLCTDFANLKDYQKHGFAKQLMPIYLNQRKGESLSQWRDRIYHEYRLSTIVAALTDLKLAYLEQISPFLSKNILIYVRELPDHLRTNKNLFKKIVNDFDLNIKYATRGAIAKPNDILRLNETTNLLKRELSSEEAIKKFPSEYLELILKELNPGNPQKENINPIKDIKNVSGFIPDFFKNVIRKYIYRPKIDYNVIAFRIYIVCKMNKLLLSDSKKNEH